MSEFVRARVKWFNKDKGYGFAVVAGRNKDVFMHVTKRKDKSDTEPFQEGEFVTFRLENGPRGEYAADIARE